MNIKTERILGVGIMVLGILSLSFLIFTFIANLNTKPQEVNIDEMYLESRYISEENIEADTFLGDEIDPEEKQGVLEVDETRKVITFDSNLTDAQISDIQEKYDVTFTNDVPKNGIYVIKTTQDSDLTGLENEYSPSIETDIPVKISTDTVDWGISRIGADKIWEFSTGSGVVVAVVDTGVQKDHPDLSSNLTNGYNFVSNTPDANDDNGHGTHVAGIVAATQNSAGTVGASHRAKIMPVKVLNSQGYGYLSDVAKGIYFAADNGARIINLSLGTSTDSITLRDAVNYASNKGVILVGAAGNDGGSPCSYPAAYSSVICVVATDSRNMLASFSNLGGEFGAPGVSNYSTYIPSTYRYLSGTSMAAPHVAGSFAVVMSACSTCNNSEVLNILRETAVDIGEPGKDIIFGYGLIDLVSAIEQVIPVEEEPETEEPIVEEPVTQPEQPAKGRSTQNIKITKPTIDKANRYTPSQIEDVTIGYTLDPISNDSDLSKIVISLDNKDLESSLSQSGEYLIKKELLNHSQHWVRVTAFFKDGRKVSNQIIIDMTYAQVVERKSLPQNSRGRSVLGISFNIFDLFRIF